MGTREPGGAVKTMLPGEAEGGRSHGEADRSTTRVEGRDQRLEAELRDPLA